MIVGSLALVAGQALSNRACILPFISASRAGSTQTRSRGSVRSSDGLHCGHFPDSLVSCSFHR